MKNLSVPLFLQPENSLDCGPTCIKMILAYYGISKELDELKSQLFYNEVGTSAYDNGYLLVKNGLSATAYMSNPLLFNPEIICTLNTNEDIANYIKSKRDFDENFAKYKNNLDTFEKYFTHGGQMKLEIPTIAHIKLAIDNDNPVFVIMNAQVLGSNEGTFHFVVITGYDEQNCYINNSWPTARHQASYPIDQLLYAIHSATCADIDNGTIIVPSKK